MKREIVRLADAESVARAAAERVAAAIKVRGAASIVLAGGSTPKRAYELLAADASLAPLWANVHLYWGDERCAPPTDADSNYAMAKAALLDRITVPAANVHRIPGELGAEKGAETHERELRARFRGAAPAFDVVLLGLGEDGHTASLFPGNVALAQTSRWVVPVETTAKAPRWRVSMTMTALCAGTTAIFLVTGAGKRAVLTEILANADGGRYPAAQVRATDSVVWLADAAALGGVR